MRSKELFVPLPEDAANGVEVLYRTVLLLDQRLNP